MRCNECIVYHNWHRTGDWKKSFIMIVTGDFMVRPCSFTVLVQQGVSCIDFRLTVSFLGRLI